MFRPETDGFELAILKLFQDRPHSILTGITAEGKRVGWVGVCQGDTVLEEQLGIVEVGFEFVLIPIFNKRILLHFASSSRIERLKYFSRRN